IVATLKPVSAERFTTDKVTAGAAFAEMPRPHYSSTRFTTASLRSLFAKCLHEFSIQSPGRQAMRAMACRVTSEPASFPGRHRETPSAGEEGRARVGMEVFVPVADAWQ